MGKREELKQKLYLDLRADQRKHPLRMLLQISGIKLVYLWLPADMYMAEISEHFMEISKPLLHIIKQYDL